MSPGVKLDNITRHFGTIVAVDRLHLEIPAGDFVTLLGPSGSGKTTTLSLIAGLERLDSGRIFLGDKDVSRTPPNERGVGMVFQNFALYPHMTVYENIAFSLRLQHRPREEIRDRVHAMASMLDISHLLPRRPGQLSGGQQQRVGLGRALVKAPKVFLLDEPFSNLDAALRSRMRTEVKHLHLRLGTTSIFVTHDQEEALALSDRIAVMEAGKIVQYGPPMEVYERPANLYVATFVGKPQMSLIDGELEQHDGELTFVAPRLRVYLGQRGTPALQGGLPKSVVLGVRPEDVMVAPSILDARPTSVSAVVQLLEPLGSDTFLELALGESTVVARVPPDVKHLIGDTVSVELTPERIHLFDRRNGERITR